MTKIYSKFMRLIISFVLSVLVAMAGVFPAILPYTVKAETISTFEQTNVLDDLKNSTIDGKEFSLTDYNFDTSKETKILSFVEYCYSFYDDKQDNYGLYIYVYNPKGLKFVANTTLNTIQFAYGLSNCTNYRKYRLEFLNCSSEKNYERLFYKFKVKMTDMDKEDILLTLNSNQRTYRVSGIELLEEGNTNATEFSVATTYNFSGYASGFGSNETASNTLSCKSEQSEVLSLKTYSTTYRPEGTNGKSDYTQDSLHSVYFAVPNTVINRYGAMTAVHAMWLNAVLKPALVTGNEAAYNEINNFLGVNMSSHNEDLNYMYLGAYSVGGGANVNMHHHGYSYNGTSWTGNTLNKTFYGEKVDKLYLNFFAGTGTDSADNYILSSDEILLKMKDSLAKFGGTAINDKYSSNIFESVDSEFTEVNIQANETFSLTSEVVSGNFWQWLFGTDGYKTTVFDGIKAICAVKDSDLNGTPAEVSKKLYISEGDYENFKSFYSSNKGQATVYLFRYQTSEYESQEASLLQETKNWLGIEQWEQIDTNAYFFKQTVNLDFDVIDVTFSNGDVETVIPVVANPIDVIPDATPPIITNSDEESSWIKLVKLIIALIFLVIIVILGWPLLKPLLGLIWKLITAPFKAIYNLIKTKKRSKERKKKDG